MEVQAILPLFDDRCKVLQISHADLSLRSHGPSSAVDSSHHSLLRLSVHISPFPKITMATLMQGKDAQAHANSTMALLKEMLILSPSMSPPPKEVMPKPFRVHTFVPSVGGVVRPSGKGIASHTLHYWQEEAILQNL